MSQSSEFKIQFDIQLLKINDLIKDFDSTTDDELLRFNSKRAFTVEEDISIMKYVCKYVKKWSFISQYFVEEHQIH